MRQAGRRVRVAVVGAAALMAARPAPAGAAEVAVRYSRFLYPSENGQGAVHLSLAQPVGRDLALAFEGARYPGSSGGLYMLTGGLRLFERSGTGPTIYAQVMAGVALEPRDGGTAVMIQPGGGLDLGSRGPATVRIQVDWPLITVSGPIHLVPQLSVGVVFRPREP